MQPPSAALTCSGAIAGPGPPGRYATRLTWAGSRRTGRSANMRGTSGMSRRPDVRPRPTRSNRGRVGDGDVAAIVSGAHDDPFRVLGLHEVEHTWMARTFIPGADRVSAVLFDGTKIGDLAQR